MLEDSVKTQLKELIKNGNFDLELISFELDIPMKELKKLVNQVEKEQKIEEEQIQANHERMQRMREKYNSIYSQHLNNQQIQKLDSVQIKKIEGTIQRIKEITEKIANQNQNEKVKPKVLGTILDEIKNIQDLQLSIEQCQELIKLLETETMKGITVNHESTMAITKIRYIIIKKLIDAINLKLVHCENVEELRKMQKLLTPEMRKQNYILISSIDSKIENMISMINQKKIAQEMKNNISPEIKKLAESITLGTIENMEAKKIIQDEIDKDKAKTGSKYSESKVIKQVKTALIEFTEIKDPEDTIARLKEILDCELSQVITIVVKNYISKNDFEKAKDICEKYSKSNKDSSVRTTLKFLKSDIRNLELAQFIIRILKSKSIPELDSSYITMLDNGLSQGNVRMNMISLGESEDGKRNITLEDIWVPQDKEKDR